MAKHAKHDGRFGKEFDDEISGRGVWGSILLVAGSMVFAFVSMIWFVDFLEERQDKPPIAATPRLAAEAAAIAAPPSTRLQVDPEGELVELRREMAKRIHGYGWVDQSGGLVHIPIDQAMALVLDRGLPRAAPSIPMTDQGTAADGTVLDGEGPTGEADVIDPATDDGAHGS